MTDPMKEALREAINQIELHNAEYQHRTSEKQIAQWKALLKRPAASPPEAAAVPVAQRPTPKPGQCPQCGEYSMAARAAQGLFGTMEGDAAPPHRAQGEPTL